MNFPKSRCTQLDFIKETTCTKHLKAYKQMLGWEQQQETGVVWCLFELVCTVMKNTCWPSDFGFVEKKNVVWSTRVAVEVVKTGDR